ncbi:5-formyltetrahydrofolate cyclo-ligase [Herbihabitans rhizosphaerae]|uniref:5-formyltetrahydrofolate cyclo-ligase n=2 Tax=Herbihabitans rhizosphaerae TaxID=1872711 RepID=A0A4Q7KW47_9PSEU|nr:5-formyltetrahydrofolate cyclo-ligase [Herbihabitans rhizosphaerae]
MRILTARRALSDEDRAREADAVERALLESNLVRTARTVCAYVPTRTEPGSPRLLETLAAQGIRVLLPVVVGAGPLDWAPFAGSDALQVGAAGMREPTTARLGPDAVATADLVLVPALAVDSSGVRLGRGAGHYDQTLPKVRPGVPLAALLRDSEFVEALPAERHDVPVTVVVTTKPAIVQVGPPATRPR